MYKCPKCQGKMTKNGKTKSNKQRYICKNCEYTTSKAILSEDIKKVNDLLIDDHYERMTLKEEKNKNKLLLSEILDLREELALYKKFDSFSDVYEIPLNKKNKTSSESVAIMQWADWHVEELVKKETVNEKNEYTPEIAKKRSIILANNTVSLTRMYQVNTTINDMVIQLGGDFITGNIHLECLENCAMRPMEATMYAAKLLKGVINFILNNTKLNLSLICNFGNHSRITKKVHISTEAGNSTEYAIYCSLSDAFENEPRVKIKISESSLAYIKICDKIFRCFHGHQVTYGGGVGGVMIPLGNKVKSYNQNDFADYNLVNHFHQSNFLQGIAVNGSMIGYNQFAQSMGFKYEPPQQNYFLFNKNKQMITYYSPVFLC